MSKFTISRQFEKMGARVKTKLPELDWHTKKVSPGICRLDVKKDAKGAFFEVIASPDVEVEVLDCQPKDRHLLFLARVYEFGREQKHKFLCGHDERDWFVAAVPERGRGVSNVTNAMEALKPASVQAVQVAKKLTTKEKKRRRTKAYKRQGEWFFLAVPNFSPSDKLILRNEPLQRGRNKPHMAEELYRTGGTTVYVNMAYPNGLTQFQFDRLKREERRGFRVMSRDPAVHVRGAIRHPDHKTLILDGWHQVVPNTENESSGGRFVAFLD